MILIDNAAAFYWPYTFKSITPVEALVRGFFTMRGRGGGWVSRYSSSCLRINSQGWDAQKLLVKRIIFLSTYTFKIS